MKKQLKIQKKLVLSRSLFESLDFLRQFIHHLSLHPFNKSIFCGALALSAWTLFRPAAATPSLNSLIISIIRPPFWTFWFVSFYSQSALLVSVTGIGGNFSGTGAEGGSRSPEDAPGPTPGGPHADTGPSEEEARDPGR